MSLLGVAGVIAAQLIGRLYDCGWSVPPSELFLTCSRSLFPGWGASIVAVLIAVALLSVGAEAVLVLLQPMIVSQDPTARSRLNG